MSEKIFFNTLKYAKMLEEAGVKNAEAHALALSFALSLNIYSKIEIDEMVENVIRRFEKQMQDFRLDVKNEIHVVRDEIHALRLEMKSDLHALETRLEKSLDTKLNVKFSLMAGFLSIVLALSHFLH